MGQVSARQCAGMTWGRPRRGGRGGAPTLSGRVTATEANSCWDGWRESREDRCVSRDPAPGVGGSFRGAGAEGPWGRDWF